MAIWASLSRVENKMVTDGSAEEPLQSFGKQFDGGLGESD